MVESASVCTPNIETLTVKLSLPSVKEIYYVGIHRPPDGNIDTFLGDLEQLIYTLTDKPNYEVNIIGDVNINFNKVRDPNGKRYKEFLKRNHLTNIILHATHFNHQNIGSCIDHFISSDPELYTQYAQLIYQTITSFLVLGKN